MRIFKREPKFIIAACPKCNGPLELDTNYETAHCKECGMQYIVQNVDKKKRQNSGKFEMLMDFIEKERDLRRKDKVEKDKVKQEQKIKEDKNSKVILIVLGITIFVIIVTILILSNIGIK